MRCTPRECVAEGECVAKPIGSPCLNATNRSWGSANAYHRPRSTAIERVVIRQGNRSTSMPTSRRDFLTYTASGLAVVGAGELLSAEAAPTESSGTLGSYAQYAQVKPAPAAQPNAAQPNKNW